MLKIFLLGFFLAPIGDMVHVATKTTSYPDTYGWYLFGIPWWVFPFFGIAGPIVAFSNDFSDKKFFGRKKRLGETTQIFAYLGLSFFLLAYILTGLLNFNPFLVHLVLGTLAVLFWFFLDKTLAGIIIGISTAIGGTSVEIFLVHNKVFTYLPPNTDLFGVATWLPWLYFILSIGLGNFLRYQERVR
jgi:hypothetical protein